MIRFITGVPGAGKTAKLVDLLFNSDEYKDRPIYQHGIEGLELGVRIFCESLNCRECRKYPDRKDGLQAHKWYDWAEENAVIVIDEAHHVWKQRSKEAAPESVARMTEHRHIGIDFLLSSQHPMFLDVDIRRLINQHWHIVKTSLGIRMIYEFPEYKQDTQDKRGGTSRIYRLPKRIFGKYKSAEKHTKIKSKLPLPVIFLLIVIPMMYFIGDFALSRIDTMRGRVLEDPVTESVGPETPRIVSREANSQNGVGAYDPISFFDFTPLVPGYPESAPAYAQLLQTVPRDFPRLKGCIAKVKQAECKCYDQNGDEYRTSLERCFNVVQGREFKLY